MNRRARRNHSPAFKAKVALAAIQGDRTLAKVGRTYPGVIRGLTCEHRPGFRA